MLLASLTEWNNVENFNTIFQNVNFREVIPSENIYDTYIRRYGDRVLVYEFPKNDDNIQSTIADITKAITQIYLYNSPKYNAMLSAYNLLAENAHNPIETYEEITKYTGTDTNIVKHTGTDSTSTNSESTAKGSDKVQTDIAPIDSDTLKTTDVTTTTPGVTTNTIGEGTLTKNTQDEAITEHGQTVTTMHSLLGRFTTPELIRQNLDTFKIINILEEFYSDINTEILAGWI